MVKKRLKKCIIFFCFVKRKKDEITSLTFTLSANISNVNIYDAPIVRSLL